MPKGTKKRWRRRGPAFAKQEFVECYDIDDEDDDGIKEEDIEENIDRPPDSLERDGDIAVDLLTRKIQLRKLVDELQVKTEAEEQSFSIKREKQQQQQFPVKNKKRSQKPISKGPPKNGRKKVEVKKEPQDVIIEDEEVMRIIGELEKEVDTGFPEVLNVTDDESNKQKHEESNKEKHTGTGRGDSCEKSESHKESIGVNTLDNNTVQNKKELGGLQNHGPYSRVLVVGDIRLQQLQSQWPEYAYVKPQFLVEPYLTLDNLKDFILSKTDLPHLENGTLMIINVGLFDVLDLINYSDCKVISNHEPMKIMELKLPAVPDLIKLVLMKLSNAYKALEETLDSRSVVCFSAILPADPVIFFDKKSRYHKPKGHAIMSTLLKENLKLLRNKIQQVCTRVNKHLDKLSPMPSVWNIMCSYHLDSNIVGRPFSDGLEISYHTSELLTDKLNRFLQELFYGVEISAKNIEYNTVQEVVVVGDSRMLELQKMWRGFAPKFYCEPELGFYNFTEYINKNLVDMKNKIVLVCLGLNDIVKFVDDDECFSEDHEPSKTIFSICENYNSVSDYMKKIEESFARSFNAFCELNPSFLYFATVYPIHLDIYKDFRRNAHKEETGHDLTSHEKQPDVNHRLQSMLEKLNEFLKIVARGQGLPIWDMDYVVSRGCKLSTLSSDVLKDGVNPSERTAEELIRSFFEFVNKKLCQECYEDIKGYKFPQRPLPKLEEKPLPRFSKAVESSLEMKSNERTSSRDEPSSVKEKEDSSEIKILDIKPTPEVKTEVETSNVSPIVYDVVSEEEEPDNNERSRPSSSNMESEQKYTSHKQKSSHSPPTHSSRSSKSKGRSRSPDKSFKAKSRSPERVYKTRNITPDKVHQRSRSPIRFPKSPEYLDRFYRRGGLSPERIERPRYPRSPPRLYGDWHSRSEHYHSYRSHRSPDRNTRAGRFSSSKNIVNENPLDIYTRSIKQIKRECERERDYNIRSALLDLCNTHNRECELYLGKPDAHPDYAKEYRAFVDKKRTYVIDLGGNPNHYDYLSDWDKFWPSRLIELFKESWELKKSQCLAMLTSKRRRSPSVSSSSSSSSSSYSSSSSSRSSRSRRKKYKKKSKHRRSSSHEHKYRKPKETDSRWKPVTSSPDSRDSDFLPAVKQSKKMDIILHSHSLDEPSTSGVLKDTIGTHKVLPSTDDMEKVKIVEVLGILAYMKDKLGVFGLPVTVLYEKAVALEKKGLNPNVLLKDDEMFALLNMLNEKFSSLTEEGEGSAIQKAIMLEAHSRLRSLLSEISNTKKKDPIAEKVNISQIASLTMGKTISETIMTIKNFLIYEGISDVSKEKLERIYLSVKEEQLKISEATSQHEKLSLERSLHHVGRDLVENTKTNEELTEEFFIGKKPYSNLDFQAPKSSLSAPSTSRSNSSMEFDEEFFTGKKFLKPDFKDPVTNRRENELGKGRYVPHKHVIPPSGLIISQREVRERPFSSHPSVPSNPTPKVDYDMLRKCLAAIQNAPK